MAKLSEQRVERLAIAVSGKSRKSFDRAASQNGFLGDAGEVMDVEGTLRRDRSAQHLPEEVDRGSQFESARGMNECPP
jgi:hypothetical protein